MIKPANCGLSTANSFGGAAELLAKPASAPETVPESAPEPAPVQELAPVPELASEPEPVAESASASVPEPAPESEPTPEVVSASVPKPESVLESEIPVFRRITDVDLEKTAEEMTFFHAASAAAYKAAWKSTPEPEIIPDPKPAIGPVSELEPVSQDDKLPFITRVTTGVRNAIDTIDRMNEHPIKSLSAIGHFCIGAFSRSMRKSKMSRKVKKGTKVYADDMVFIKDKNQIIAYQYAGNESSITIPAYVGKLPVVAIHPKFFGTGPRALRGALVSLQDESDAWFDIDANRKMIKEVNLPETIQVLPDNLFKSVTSIKSLIIPASVKYMYRTTFAKADGPVLIFNGRIPASFEASGYDNKIYVRRDGSA